MKNNLLIALMLLQFKNKSVLSFQFFIQQTYTQKYAAS